MRLILVLFIVILGFSKSHSQFFSFDLWKLKKEWGLINFEKANTARFSPYMLWSQKRIILYLNLARQDGEKFMELVVDPFFKNHPELISQKLHPLPKLEKAKDLNMLYPSFRLWLGAIPHAIISGISGITGHQGFDFRMSMFLNLGTTGENCHYGYFKPLKTSLSWMNSPGHCSNIINDEFSRLGIAKMPHLGYGWNTVNTFSGPKFSDIMLRNHMNFKSIQFNIRTLTDFQNLIFDISVGQRKNINVNSARWAIGTELYPFRKESLIGYKLHWASEYQYGGIGANAIIFLDNNGFYPVFRPEVSVKFPFTINFNKGSYSAEFLNLEKSNSSIGISYGHNLILHKYKELPVGKHVISVTYTRNFLFQEKLAK